VGINLDGSTSIKFNLLIIYENKPLWGSCLW
jgi:hypothetical protein